MTNAEKYHFADFTRANYRRLIRMAKEKYTFRSYTDFQKDKRFILMRHDVDFSVHGACKFAQIESEEGISSTYFLLLHSEFYNLLEREITECVREIIGLGHNIGLHFDSHYYGISDQSELERWLAFETKILEQLFGQKISTFSFHITTPFTKSCSKWQYAGLINPYADYFHKNVGYCSDSNGYWRFQRLEDVLQSAKDECLQVLTHPAWWQDVVMSPMERIHYCVDGRAQKTKEWYEKIAEEYKRAYVDWD